MITDKKRQYKVLWLSSLPPFPLIANSTNFSGGWLSGAYGSIKTSQDIDLIMMFPVSKRLGEVKGHIDGFKYFGFSLPRILKLFKIKFLQKIIYRRIFNKIIQTVNPDILHVFGTEELYSRMAIESFNNPKNTVIHIQGLASVYAHHSLFGFPFWARHLIVPYSILNGTIYGKSRKFHRAGIDEVQSIKATDNIMGRTEWDEACCRAINASMNYIHCGESLRNVFYDESSQWNYEDCKKYTVYFSQCNSQVKGMHLVLPVLPKLIKQYPHFHMYVGGYSPLSDGSLMGYLKKSTLEIYLTKLINKYKLHNYITFLGPQNDVQVVQNLKNAHVFLSSSLIENSPNSVGEAMIVGTPVISSDVGGVKDFIHHGENGFIYPMNEPYMIPYYISQVFEDDTLATRFSQRGKEVARGKYDRTENGNIVLDTYRKIGDVKTI